MQTALLNKRCCFFMDKMYFEIVSPESFRDHNLLFRLEDFYKKEQLKKTFQQIE